MASALDVVALSGSLRRDSYNTAALHAAQELAPEGMTIEIAAIDELPLYNADIQAVGFPSEVLALGAEIAAADAVLIASPEYNYSIPGVLKNAIDWVSRLPDQPFAGKPIGLIGASMGMQGAARAQYHLRQSFVFLDALPMNRPEVFIAQAQLKFDKDGKLTDEPARDAIRQHLESLAAWTRRLQGTVPQ